VKTGETLPRIAARYRVSVEDLRPLEQDRPADGRPEADRPDPGKQYPEQVFR